MDTFIQTQNKTITKSNRKRHVLVEYVLIRDVNDSPKTAMALGALLGNRDVLLNVIPYNPTDVPFDYQPPALETCEEFVSITRELGVHTLFRQKMGDDIASACGQLVIENKTKNLTCGSGDVEDLAKLPNNRPDSTTTTTPTPLLGGGKGGVTRRVQSKRKNNSKKSDVQDQEEEEGIRVEMGKLGENIPGVLVQYSILGLVCWGVYRWAVRMF